MALNDIDIEYSRYKAMWERCRDVLSGKDAVNEKGSLYLPRLSKQTDEEYRSYQMRAGWFDASGLTYSTFLGMIMRKDPVIQAPAASVIDDITNTGVSLVEFATVITKEVLKTGRVGVLVDYTVGGEMTQAESMQSGQRPYAVMYKAEQILPVVRQIIDGRNMITQIRLLETSRVQRDEFDWMTTQRVRVLDLHEGRYRVRVFNDDDELTSEVYPMMGGKYMNFIPFYFINSEGLTDEYNKPPLMGIVEANLDYYRTKADYKLGSHYSALPTPVIFSDGMEEDEFTIGSNIAWKLSGDAKAEYLEIKGQGLAELSKELKSLREEMSAMGVSALEVQKRVAEAVDSHIIQRSGEINKLSSLANYVSRGLEKVGNMILQWAGVSGKVSIELNTDFIPVEMSVDDVIKLLEAARDKGPFTWHDVIYNLRIGERLDPSIDDKTRIKNIEE